MTDFQTLIQKLRSKEKSLNRKKISEKNMFMFLMFEIKLKSKQ